MQLYYFIIWNHGIKHMVDILSIIRNTPNVKVKNVLKIKPKNLDKFLDEVYKFDISTLKKQHIESKKRYLQENPTSESCLILVENQKEKLFQMHCGTSCCRTIRDLKDSIREKFPSDIDEHGAYNHVCHSCDRAFHTPPLLQFLNLHVEARRIKAAWKL